MLSRRTLKRELEKIMAIRNLKGVSELTLGDAAAMQQALSWAIEGGKFLMRPSKYLAIGDKMVAQFLKHDQGK